MKLFVIIATVVVCACAAPTVELQHPSPVNPNVLVEIKPEEKIILITDPKELAKFKRETKQPFYPTVLPQGHVHHITKRENKPGQEIKPIASTEYISVEGLQKQQILPVILPQVVVVKETPIINQNQEQIPPPKKDIKESLQDKIDEKKDTPQVYQKPHGLPAIFSPSNKVIQQKRDIPVPLTSKSHHPEESLKESHEEKQELVEKPQGLPAIFSPSNDVTQQQKHDIPMPLVPIYHHPEEYPKGCNEKESHEDKKELHSENQYATSEGYKKPQTSPLILKETSKDTQQKRDIPVPLVPTHHNPEESPKENIEKEAHENKKEKNNHEGFQKPQTLPVILKETAEDTQQHKRDIPVPLIHKHHHPEESPKENIEKEARENKKEENHHEGFQKPQTLPVILKKTAENTQQHKRDIPVPLVPKHHHPEESPKENIEKEAHENKKEENHHEGFQKPQTLPVILKETAEDTQQHKRDIPVPLVPKHHHPEESPKENIEKEAQENKKEENHYEGFQKPQTLPVILKETTEDTQQHKRDIPVPLVPKHHHPEESPKENIEKEAQENKKEENHYEGFQKPQTLSVILKETTEDTQQHKRDIPVPLVPKHHHPEESPKENNQKEAHENKKEENHHEGFQNSQTFPVILKETTEDTQQHKRDIPVPLVPKHHHPEESPKEINQKEAHEDKKEQNHHEEFQKPQIHPVILKKTTEDMQQHKRDIPVPLVPKYHHPEESPKQSNEKESDEEKKEIISENHHSAVEGLQKPQTLPAILKETTGNTQQQTRDTVPEVVNKDSPKENINEKASHEDKTEVQSENHHVPQIHHIPQAFPTHNHEYVTSEGFHKPQNPPTYHHEHFQQPGFHKIQIKPKHHEQFIQKDNEKNLPQTLQKPHEHHYHPEILRKPTALTETTDAINHQKHDLPVPTIGHHKETQKEFTENKKEETKQIIGDHSNPHEVQIEDLSQSIYQRPINHDLKIQSKNEPNESNENKEKVRKSADDHPNIHDVQVEDLSGSIYQKPVHHHTLPVQGDHKESNENKEKVKKSTDNQHEVQVEDLPGSIYQKPIHYDLPMQSEHKPNILDDHLSAYDHPILRRRPVPVSELFARAHDN